MERYVAVAPTNNNAIRPGLLVGLVLAVVAALITTLYDVGALPSIIQCPEFLAILTGSFVAGMLGAKATGRVVSGLLAGLIASVCAAVIILGANIVMAIIAPQAFATAFGWHGLDSGALIGIAVGQSLVGLVIWAIAGLVMGVLGGLLGRRQAASQSGPTSVPH